MSTFATPLTSKRFSHLFYVLFLTSIVWTSKPVCVVAQSFTLPVKEQLTDESKPWVFWYWMKGAVSAEGITADLEAMKAVGIGGAYLMPIMEPGETPIYQPPALQLTEHWWTLVRHAMQEARRLELDFAMHACDGFALAGGPWIRAEHSMQRVVWTVTAIQSPSQVPLTLQQPPSNEDYYRDIAVLAMPAPKHPAKSDMPMTVTSDVANENARPNFLALDDAHTDQFVSKESCWIQYEFEQPFTLRSLTIKTRSPTTQAHRFVIKSSEDGNDFRKVTTLSPPRHGWQDSDAPTTHAIPTTTARFFRFEFDPTGAEPGSEDLDSAKWKPTLKLTHLLLSSEPKIHQFEGKTGAVWRIAPGTSEVVKSNSPEDPHQVIPSLDSVLDLTDKLLPDGSLQWTAPEGDWLVYRIGHTSTGHKNETAGGGKGLECDKLNAAAVNLQFDQWYGKIIENIGPEAAKDVLKIFHVDSWECGSQNWTHDFTEQFVQRRGYSLRPWLPVFAGLPIESLEASEQVLLDVRITINELLQERFFGTLQSRVKQAGDLFSAESVAPTMLCDSLEHYRSVDIPMGEFWLNSPTHDKPNDMFDAISGAHIYGKNIVQAESFTQLRMQWNEHPAMLKSLGDQQFARGINRIVFHVFCQNPWADRKPGVTLNGVGLFFQRDQTWWKQSTGWLEYLRRCQHLLQQGQPVCELAVFTGEDLPRRALLPQQLVNSLPGLFDPQLLNAERDRLSSGGVALQQKPAGVVSTAGILSLDQWNDPLLGYKYDSLNRNQFLHAEVDRDRRIVLPSGTTYEVLVFPAAHSMNSGPGRLSLAVLRKIDQLLRSGAKIVLCERPNECIVNQAEGSAKDQQSEFIALAKQLYSNQSNAKDGLLVREVGKGILIEGPITAASLQAIGVQPHLKVATTSDVLQPIATMHRATTRSQNVVEDMYFVANRLSSSVDCEAVLRRNDGFISIYDPMRNRFVEVNRKLSDTKSPFFRMEPNGSVFLFVSAQPIQDLSGIPFVSQQEHPVSITVGPNWRVQFDKDERLKSEQFDWEVLRDWKDSLDKRLTSFSGTATYENKFSVKTEVDPTARYVLRLGDVHQLAEVWINDQPCGIAWAKPYEVDITDQLKAGENTLKIAITNTWRNRLIHESQLPEEERKIWTLAPLKFENSDLESGGLLGPISLVQIPNSPLP